jgi:plasmid stabilization system protein ParE
MKEVVWTLGAEVDVQRLYERMEQWDEGAGDRFYAEVLDSISLLRLFPDIGVIVHRQRVRRVLVFNRNYGLFYVNEPRGLVIHALLDLRQHPAAIRRRLGEI